MESSPGVVEAVRQMDISRQTASKWFCMLMFSREWFEWSPLF